MSNQLSQKFSPASGAARWTQGLLIAGMVLALAGVVTGALQIAGAGEAVPEGELDPREALHALVGLLQFVVWLGTAAAFLAWFYRSHKNLPALGSTRHEYSPGWAVGGFFVPFLNLVRPVQVMREVWYCSDPSGLERDSALDAFSVRKQLGTPPLIGWWWAFLLLSSFTGNVAGRARLISNPTPELLQFANVVAVISDVLDIPAAFLAIRLVGRLTSWQAERNNLIQQRAGTMAAAAAAPAPIS